ncbi:MAG: very short patch repair endonuclease [Candidatus Dormibacteria bacterium]
MGLRPGQVTESPAGDAVTQAGPLAAGGASRSPRRSRAGARDYVPWASSEATRRVMQGNRSSNTSPEVRLRSALHRSGLRFFKHRRPDPQVSCRVDIVFPRARLAVFLDGCFWHACPDHGTRPAVHAEWWDSKLARNRDRDRRNDAELIGAGWRVLRVWEHEEIDSAVSRIRFALDRPRG